MSCKCKIGLLYIIGENMIAMYMSFIDSEDDREKFEIIYHEYRKRMVSVAYSILHNNEDSEDAVHETFIRIAKNMKAIDDPRSKKTAAYVITAAKNNAINLFNKNKRAREHIFTGDIGNLTDERFFEKMSLTESYKEIVNAVELLNETYRDVMYYHFVCDMKIKDIADLLGEKPSAVQQKLIRGKKKLLEILDDDLRD